MEQPEDAARGHPSPLVVAAVEREARALGRLRAALDRGGAFLAFQAVVDPANPAAALFHESLFRIRDETGREVPAQEFMPAAETREIGREVDRTALALALRELADHPALALSVNLSARSIGDPEWMHLLARALARRPDIGPRLVVELTESAAPALPCLLREAMHELRAARVRIALDDFGAGYSSLAYLRDYRFDILKIDGRFARGIERDPDSRALVRPMLALARHFGMLAVLEQVETAAQANALARMGAGGLQGYHFGRPTARPAWRPQQSRRAARA